MTHKPHRKLYKIGHLCELLGLTHRTIRYYDQMGLLPHVKRSDGGVRLFDDEDIEIIKKIRKLQKEDYLPLDVIKERLFNKQEGPGKSCYIVTDATILLDFIPQKADPLSILPIGVGIDKEVFLNPKQNSSVEIWKRADRKNKTPELVGPTVEQFVDTYQKIKEKGYEKIYSIHVGSAYGHIAQTAKLAAERLSPTMDIQVVDTKATGLGLGLFVSNILSAIQQGRTIDELDHLVTKQLPMVYHIGLTHHFKHLLLGKQTPREPLAANQLLESLYSFYPIYLHKDYNDTLQVSACLPSKEEAYAHILEKLAEEFEARGRYTSKVVVGYDYFYAEAEKLLNGIKAIFPNTPTALIELNGLYSTEFGPGNIAVSLI